MDFKQEINELEKYLTENNFEIKTGSVPILFSAPHTMIQTHHDGTVKLSEPYTKAISLYLNKYDKRQTCSKLSMLSLMSKLIHPYNTSYRSTYDCY